MKSIKRLVAVAVAFIISSTMIYGNGTKVQATTSNYEESAGSKPNIVFMLVDDMGYTDTSLYGSEYYETPNLERLAEEGIMFTDAYAGSNLCSPSRATILTGRDTTRNGVDRLCNQNEQAYITGENPSELINQNGFLVSPEPTFLPKSEITIPEMLKEAGYKSAHIGKWHLGDPARGYGPLDQGYDVNIGGYYRGQPPTYFDPYKIPTLENKKTGEYLTDRLADEAVEFIKDNKDEPFFLNLSHYGVHTPLEGKPELVQKYKDKEKTENHKNPTYAAMIESVDDSLGKIMDTLEELGLEENTIIIFTSDNGGIHYWDVTNNAPLREGKCYNYEGGTRIPAVMKWKGKIEENQVSDEIIHHSDYFPTFAEAAGVALPDDRVIDGKSLLPMLVTEEELDRETLCWFTPHFNPDSGPNIVPSAAIRHGDYKLIKHYAENSYSNGTVELFNLKEDIGEKNNLANEMPDKVKELDIKLTKWLNETEAVIPVKKGESIENQLKIPQSNMTAKATSQETAGENAPASKAIDGNPNSIWHTAYNNNEMPQSITIDLGEEYNINKFSYLPRQGGGVNGIITGYKLYVSTDGENYNHVSTGTWANNSTEKIIEFEKTEARYVKLRATSAVNNFVSAAEINVYKTAETSEILPSESITQVGMAPMMPETVLGQTEDGIETELTVEWNNIEEGKYNEIGNFEVEGTVNGSSLKAMCNVIVEEKPKHKESLVAESGLFNGNDNEGYKIIESTEDINLNDEVSIEFKILPEKINGKWQNLIGKVDSEGNGFQVNLSPEGKIVFHGGKSIIPDNLSNPWRTFESKEPLELNEWTEVRISFSKRLSRVRLYINDELNNEKRVVEPLENNNSPIVIGANSSVVNKFTGKLDSINIYNKFIQDKSLEVQFEKGDFNKDGKVDLSDLAIASKNYGRLSNEYDLDGDGKVYIYEINYIADQMLKN